MGFRDNNIAHHEREKAELRDKLAKEREHRERAEEALRRYQARTSIASKNTDEEDEELLRQMGVKRGRPSVRASSSWLLEGIWTVVTYPFVLTKNVFLGIWDTLFPSYGRWGGRDYSLLKFFGILAIIVLFIGTCIHHEFYDIRDGYVTDKDYTPGYWSTDCTGSGSSRSCSETYHPPTWSVTINFEGDSAKWEVSEGEYNQISYGDWYCARDFLHEAPCVRNKQF